MDVVRDAFIRYLALEKWRELDDLRTTRGLDWARAIDKAGRFPGRGRYESLWVRTWRAEVRAGAGATDAGALFASVERAVVAALGQEEAERRARGDGPIEEDPEYNAFVDGALGRLAREAAGQLEEI